MTKAIPPRRNATEHAMLIGKPEVGNTKCRNIQRQQWPTFDVNGKHRKEENGIGGAIKTRTIKER